jgi:hypothetical protein
LLVDLPTHVEITAQQSGLQYDSLIVLEQTAVFDKSQLIKKLGHLNDEIFNEILEALIKVIRGTNTNRAKDFYEFYTQDLEINDIHYHIRKNFSLLSQIKSKRQITRCIEKEQKPV